MLIFTFFVLTFSCKLEFSLRKEKSPFFFLLSFFLVLSASLQGRKVFFLFSPYLGSALLFTHTQILLQERAKNKMFEKEVKKNWLTVLRFVQDLLLSVSVCFYFFL